MTATTLNPLTSTFPYRLLAPGPVPVPPAVLKAMSEKVLHHRTPAFEKILNETWKGLKFVFATQQPVLMISGTGSAAMEAALINTLQPGDEVLCVVSGKFGERWAEMCERMQLKTHRWNLPWGEKLDLEKFEALLREHSKIHAVLSQACETSTGTLHPIEKMAKLIRQVTPQALFQVDAITAAGCTPMPMDEWELDVVVAGSQKAFMIPTGLSFISLSERAWAKAKQTATYKYYFDLLSEKKANQKNETYFSSPTQLIVGLHVVLEQMQARGIQIVEQRCRALAGATRCAGASLGLKTFSESPSPSVTALVVPEDQDSAKLRDWLEREKNITVMGGQDQLKGKVLRIGHMGDIHNEDMLALFQALGEKLNMDSSAALRTLKEELDHVPLLFDERT